MTGLQALLSADGVLMTLLTGFAAGTPGFSVRLANHASMVVFNAIEQSDASFNTAAAMAMLEVLRQVTSCQARSLSNVPEPRSMATLTCIAPVKMVHVCEIVNAGQSAGIEIWSNTLLTCESLRLYVV